MRRRGVRVVILCEDLLHATFARRFLMARGFASDEVIVRLLAKEGSAQGECGEHWVRKRFPVELQAYRNARSRVRQGLVVIVDADKRTVAERVRGLELACREQQVPPRQSGDCILYAIPRRNITTWFAYLAGEPFNEKDDYPAQERRYHGHEADCQPLVDHLNAMCVQKQLDGEPPDSLEACCREFERFWGLIEMRGR